jgi:hypothetical protein
MENNSNIEYKPIFEKNNIVLKNENLDVTDELIQIFGSEDSTIIIKFKSNNKLSY